MIFNGLLEFPTKGNSNLKCWQHLSVLLDFSVEFENNRLNNVTLAY